MSELLLDYLPLVVFIAVALGICLVVGVLVMPPLIWLIGSAKLGPYVGGGLFALWRDYALALIKGSLAFWLVALGPYALLWLLAPRATGSGPSENVDCVTNPTRSAVAIALDGCIGSGMLPAAARS